MSCGSSCSVQRQWSLEQHQAGQVHLERDPADRGARADRVDLVDRELDPEDWVSPGGPETARLLRAERSDPAVDNPVSEMVPAVRSHVPRRQSQKRTVSATKLPLFSAR